MEKPDFEGQDGDATDWQAEYEKLSQTLAVRYEGFQRGPSRRHPRLKIDPGLGLQIAVEGEACPLLDISAAGILFNSTGEHPMGGKCVVSWDDTLSARYQICWADRFQNEPQTRFGAQVVIEALGYRMFVVIAKIATAAP